ncbi:MAG: hypothetical protein JWM35_879 [Verrucomicrobia bacterium]|nr:hypothetical protein [Verrucomicrobiota bacterium]
MAIALVAALAGTSRGQTVLSGSYVGASISGDIQINAGQTATFSSGTSFSGTNARLFNSASLNWNQSGSLTGKIFTMGASGQDATIQVGNGYTLTLGTGTALNGLVNLYGNTSSTIINQGTISQTAATGYFYGPSVTNANGGVISVTGGASFYFGYYNGESTINASGATITSSGTNSTIYLHNVANSGTLSADTGGVLQFTGASTTTANLGTVTLASGGRALLNNTIDNTSATLNAPTGGVYELYAGTINNGSVASGALTFTNSGGTLSNVSLLGNLTMPGGTSVTFTNGTNFVGANAVLGNYSQINWNQSATLSGKNISFGSGGGAYASIYVGSGGSFVAGSTTVLAGDIYLYGATGASILNQGTINQTNGSGYLYAPTATNAANANINVSGGSSFNFGYYNGETTTNAASGTITVTGASSIVYLHSLINNGVLNALNGGVLQFTGASTTTANLGTVNLASGGRALLNNTIDNTAATLAAPTGGQYELYGGTISNGTVANGALSFTNSGGTLSNVSLLGNFAMPGSTSVTFTNGTAFTGTTGTLGNYSQITWNQNTTLSGKSITFGSGGGAYGTIYVGNGNSFTADSATTLTGDIYVYGTTSSSITNQGTINQTNGSGYFYAPTATNASGGTITVSGGSSLYFGYYGGETTTNAAGGTITANGAGSIVYLHSIINNGTLNALNSGVLQFTGASTTTANLGSVTLASGGRALLNNAIDNTSATLAAPTGGVYELYAGTITNGTIGAGALTFTNSGGTLSNVSYTGNFTMPGSTSVTFTNGTAFTGATATLGNYSTLGWNQNTTLTGKNVTFGTSTGAYAMIYVGTGYTFTSDSASTLSGDVYIYGSTGSTLINQGVFNQTNGSGYFYAPTATNASGGTITASGGASLYFGYYNGETTTNAAGGTITANGTNSIIYLHGLINNGTLNALNNGVLQFTGTSTTTANLGSVTLASGGRALLNNTIDNTSATLAAPTGGMYELYAGTINNGSIAAGGLTFTNSGGTLSNVSFLGNFVMPGGTSVTFTNGTAFTGATATLGNYSQIYWNQVGTLTGKTVTFGSGGGAYATIYVGNGDSFTNASTLTGGLYLYGTTGSTLINQGTMNYTSGTGYFYGPTVTNAAGGNITASGGASLYFGYYNGESTSNASGATITSSGSGSTIYLHNINNQGSLVANNSGVLTFTGTGLTTADLGSISLASGGRALLNGNLDNTAATLNALIGGSFELYGGTIANGTVGAGGLNFTNSGGTVNGVAFAGDLTFANNAYAYFTNGTNFAGANATLGSGSSIYWQQSGTLAGKTIAMGSGAYIYVNGVGNSLTLSPTTTITGNAALYSDGSAGTTITNQGTINQTTGSSYLYARNFTNSGTINVTGGNVYLGVSSAGYNFSNPSGGSIVVNGGTAQIQSAFTNGGMINVQSGTLYTSTYLTNGTTGTVMGSGTINGNLTVAGGTLSPGNSVGTLTLASSSFSVTAASLLNIEISAATADKMFFTSPSTNVDIGSGLLSLSIALLSAPTNGTTYTIMSISGGAKVFAGRFAGLPNSGDSLTATFGAQSYQFFVNYLPTSITVNFTPVPEPSTYVLLAGGLATLGFGAWRRRRTVARA